MLYYNNIPSYDNSYSILIAHRDIKEAQDINNYLTKSNFTTLVVSSNKEVLERIKENHIKIIIWDSKLLVKKDVIYTLDKIKDNRVLYIITLITNSDFPCLIKKFKNQIDDFLLKPVIPQQLLLKVNLLDRLIKLERHHQKQVQDLLAVMGDMLGSRDHCTLEHSKRVAQIATRAAKLLDFSQREIKMLEVGCLLHDIGKIAIPDEVLLKPGKFNSLDRKLMKLHPIIGANFIQSRIENPIIFDIILKHHERLDGSGYPFGIKEKDIPPLVRLVSVSDILEALIAKRPYKPPLSIKSACSILRANVNNNKLDPKCVEAVTEVVKTWDPLSIELEPCIKDIKTVEQFRQICYFREPLSNFFNYRFLLTIDLSKEIREILDYYHLILIDFKELRKFNKRWGYLRADQCLDELGESILQVLEDPKLELDERFKMIPTLYKKGADYLILSLHKEENFSILCEKLRSVLNDFYRHWGLSSRLLVKKYPSYCSFEQALDYILIMEQEDQKLININASFMSPSNCL